MKTAGYVLRRAREEQKKTLEEITKETRIKEKFLAALESDEYTTLPGFPTALGFAKSYAASVGQDPDLVAALLRRDFPQTEAAAKSKELPLVPASFWTPRTTIFVTVFATVLLLGAYLARQYILFAGPPPLEITRVAASDNTVEVQGKTTPAATVEVNGEAVLVDEDGLFRFQTNGGQEEVEIKAVSRAGKKTVVRRELD